MNSSRRNIFFILLALICWLPVLWVGFLNDDFQIVGWHSGKNFSDCLRPFYTADVSGYYWRPLGNSLHALTLWLFGFTPLPFRLTNFILYALACILVYYTGKKIGLSETGALIAGIIFSVLPSHELPVAWIAGRGETMTAIFLLLSALFYINGKEKNPRKNFFLSGIFFLFSILTKELAFAGILLPFVLQKDFSKEERKFSFSAAAVASMLLAGVIAYRLFMIGGNPFASPHFASGGFFCWIKNFFLYIPVAFFSPDTLEAAAYNWRTYGIISLLFLGIIYLFTEKNFSVRTNSLIAFRTIAWFLIFILPALPTFMRWYVFVASIGLVWLLGAYLDALFEKISRKKIFFFAGIFVGLLFYAQNFSQMLAWQRTSEIVTKALNSLKKYREENFSHIDLYAVPDKIERVSALKIGTQEAVQWAIGNKNIDVRSPLRTEFPEIVPVKYSLRNDTLRLYTYMARFLPLGEKSRAVIISEKISSEIDEKKIFVETYAGERIESSAMAYPIEKHISFVFDGEKFIRLK